MRTSVPDAYIPRRQAGARPVGAETSRVTAVGRRRGPARRALSHRCSAPVVATRRQTLCWPRGSCVMEMGSTVHVRRTCSVQRCAVQRTPFATWRHEISSESARATSALACGCRACAGVRILGMGGETRGWRRACEAIARLNPIFGVPPPCAGATASSSLGGERARFFGGKATTSGSANGEVGPRGGGRGGAGGVLSVAQKLASASRSASVTSGRGPRRAWSGVEGEVGVSREARGG